METNNPSRVTVFPKVCTGGCGTRLHAPVASLALCPACRGLYQALDAAGVRSIPGLERRDRLCARLLAVVLSSGAVDAAEIAAFAGRLFSGDTV